jgi:micrococcal nuclease
MQQASVVRIVDGDTLRAIVDGVEEQVRLFGVDTPERGEPCFQDATDVLRSLVATNGGQIRLQRDQRNRDSYDRLLRYVYTPAGLSIDAVLIAGGYGYAWTRDGALRDALVEVEAVARLQSRGCLWR